MLKRMPKNLLFSKKEVAYTRNVDRRQNNNATGGNRTDEYLTKRITKFSNLIGYDNTYRIPLRLFVELRLVNQPIKMDIKMSALLKEN